MAFDFQKDIIELYYDLKAIMGNNLEPEFEGMLLEDGFTLPQVYDIIDYISDIPSQVPRFESGHILVR